MIALLEKFNSSKTEYRESMVLNERVIWGKVLHGYLYPKCTTGYVMILEWIIFSYFLIISVVKIAVNYQYLH